MNSKPIEIVLDFETSEILTETGQSCFVVTGKASWPDDPARWVLYLIPCDIKTGDAAVRVAMGKSTERRITPKP